jgi:DNA glycosylase AlkZ-like
MTISLSNSQVRLLRLRSQRLLPQSSNGVSSVTQIVKELCGIQAQELPSAALAVRVRSAALLAADVEQARVQERSIVRTWGMRGTLHLLATEDLGWLLPLLSPVFIAGDRRRRAELGLDEDTCARGMRVLRAMLANHGHLTRAEIVEQLASHDIHLEGQARSHFLSRAALEGIICFGPNRGTEPTYVLLSDWLDQKDIELPIQPCNAATRYLRVAGLKGEHPLSEDAAYAKLSLRYLHAYGPATPEDQAAWSGMSLSKTRAAWQYLADQLLEVNIAGSPAWMLKTQSAWLEELPPFAPVVRLLPRYDVYLLGYQNRDLMVPRQYAKRINAGGGIVHPALLVDGQVVGTWKSQRVKDHLDVRIEPFGALAPEVQAGLEAEVADIGRFLRVQTSLQAIS